MSLARYLNRSRDVESVKWLQQDGKRGKFLERPSERGKIAGLLPGWLSFFNLSPGVFEWHCAVEYQCTEGRI